jgi:hypothetical protein
MNAPLRVLLVAAVAWWLPTPAQAQPVATPTAAGSAPCTARPIAGLSAADAELVARAGRDPIVGCAALDATWKAGDVTVAPTDTIRGNLVAVGGTLRVAGMVTGTAIALNGAVVIDSTGHVQGDVISAEHGAAIAANGRVDGELRTIDELAPTVVTAAAAPVADTLSSLARTAVWFGILIVLGIGVLINSGDAMQRVTSALHAGFGQNVMVGILAQMALLPVLVLICVLLALTVIGILLIPFAIVAYVIGVLGLLVLGGLGAVQMIGAGVAPRRPATSERGARLQALVTGMLLFSVPWLIAAALASRPVLSAAISTVALGITWLAVTAGLGATLRTRGGTRSPNDPWGIRRPAPSGAPLPVESPKPEWLTPTPLTGVVAVKRPTSTTGSGSAR